MLVLLAIAAPLLGLEGQREVDIQIKEILANGIADLKGGRVEDFSPNHAVISIQHIGEEDKPIVRVVMSAISFEAATQQIQTPPFAMAGGTYIQLDARVIDRMLSLVRSRNFELIEPSATPSFLIFLLTLVEPPRRWSGHMGPESTCQLLLIAHNVLPSDSFGCDLLGSILKWLKRRSHFRSF